MSNLSKTVVSLLLCLIAFGVKGQSQLATFAGGCFWCMQPVFDEVPGVLETVVGYAGGNEPNPSYEDVSSGGTGYLESIQIKYDTNKITYQKLLHIFWHNIDPLDNAGQFCDKGSQYRSVIFYHDAVQMEEAKKSEQALKDQNHFANIYTEIRPFTTFYPAEEYHQKYYQKNPVRYKYYRFRCGRDQRLKEIWQKNSYEK